MDDIIKLKSKGHSNYLKKLKSTTNKESKTYKLVSDSRVTRYGLLEDGNYYINPSGGPLIVENNYIGIDDSLLVSSIIQNNVLGFIITFK